MALKHQKNYLKKSWRKSRHNIFLKKLVAKLLTKYKNGIENIKTLILMDLSAIIVIFGIFDEITKWQESVVMCVGALLAVFIPGIGYAIVYHKYKRLKNIDSSGCLLEYTNVVLDVGKETKFLCSDGHME